MTNTQFLNYYNRREVSNSDLTALKELLHPRMQFGDKETAFRMGTLVDALVTEPERANHYERKVDDYNYTMEEWQHGLDMKASIFTHALKDSFLSHVLQNAETQHCMANEQQGFIYGSFLFHLNTRCKWDWFFPFSNFGGDLKTTSASSQKEFEEAIDFFDWDRSRAWYMDIAGSDRDFIYAVSKKNGLVFKKFIQRGDEVYSRGKEKYEDLAFQWWCLNLQEQ